MTTMSIIPHQNQLSLALLLKVQKDCERVLWLLLMEVVAVGAAALGANKTQRNWQLLQSKYSPILGARVQRYRRRNRL